MLLPQVVYQGGPVLAAPAVVTVTFAGDALAGQLASFGQSVASSSWWDAVRVGYCGTGATACVGDGPPGTSIELTTAPAPTYTDSAVGGPSSLKAWLSGAIMNGTLPAPAANSPSNTVYVVYFPDTTAIDFDGIESCANDGFDGYHDWLSVGDQMVTYIVAMECAALPPVFPTVAPTSVLQSATITASHELVEASTDPVPPGTSQTSPGGFALDSSVLDNWAWIDLTGGGEAADMCVDLFGLNQDQTSDGTFTVQRIWSNAQAASGVDPCNPMSGEVYFNAAPEKTAFFVVGVGDSVTFDVDAFSDGPVPPWTLSAQDWSDSSAPYLSFSISGGASTDGGPVIKVSNGSKVQVTMTLLMDPGELPTGEADGSIISVSGDIDQPTAAHFWPVAVMSPADAADAGVNVAEGARRDAVFSRRNGIRKKAPRPRPGTTRARF